METKRFKQVDFELGGGNVSGSKVSKIIHEPITMFLVQKKLIKPIYPGEDPSKGSAFNKWIKEKMEWGNILEDTVLKNSQINKEVGEIKFDKNSYALNKYPTFRANIDGFIGKNIENIDYIIENKITQSNSKLPNSGDMTILINRYKYQVYYYMWFFQAKKGGILNLLFNGGTNLYSGVPKLTFKEEQEFIQKLIMYDKAVNENNMDLITWSSLEDEIDKNKNPFNTIISWKNSKIDEKEWNFSGINFDKYFN